MQNNKNPDMFPWSVLSSIKPKKTRWKPLNKNKLEKKPGLHMSVILALEKLRQEDHHESKNSLCYGMRLCLRRKDGMEQGGSV